MIKSLTAPYRPAARSESWVKLKPDYLTLGEFDCVVLGWRAGTAGGDR